MGTGQEVDVVMLSPLKRRALLLHAEGPTNERTVCVAACRHKISLLSRDYVMVVQCTSSY